MPARLPDDRPDLLTRPEAAAYLRMSVRSLARRSLGFDGPPLVRLGRRVFYLRSDLDRWLAQRRDVLGGPHRPSSW